MNSAERAWIIRVVVTVAAVLILLAASLALGALGAYFLVPPPR
jgi:hypothetical protein